VDDGRVSDDHSNYGAENIREDDAGTGEPDGDRTTEEESDSDRTADGHHSKLTLREPAFESARVLDRVRCGGWRRH
jgi:hypothetical protein